MDKKLTKCKAAIDLEKFVVVYTTNMYISIFEYGYTHNVVIKVSKRYTHFIVIKMSIYYTHYAVGKVMKRFESSTIIPRGKLPLHYPAGSLNLYKYIFKYRNGFINDENKGYTESVPKVWVKYIREKRHNGILVKGVLKDERRQDVLS